MHSQSETATPGITPRAPFMSKRAASPTGPHEKLLALDIETVRDPVRTPRSVPADAFPKPVFHEIVAVSYATARIIVDDDGTERFDFERCASGGEPDWDEARLLAAFWRFFGANRFRVVSWNGRKFDMAVLRLRAMLHGVPTPDWYRRGDRWRNYASRYAPDWHTDVMDSLADYGATTAMGLDETARLLGLPGKIGGSGAGVAEMVAAGGIGDVRAYCEGDVLNTLTAYYRFCHLSGRSTSEGHDASVESLERWLETESASRPHLREFLDGWSRRRLGSRGDAARRFGGYAGGLSASLASPLPPRAALEGIDPAGCV